MKTILYLFIICIATSSFTSNAQSQTVKDTLSMSKVVCYEQKIDFEDYGIKFKKLIADSRCPKNVMCVRAGEAIVLISIYKNGKFIKDKQISIDASGYVMENTNLVFETNVYKIYAYSLTPYPVMTNTIANKTYQLELKFLPIELD